MTLNTGGERTKWRQVGRNALYASVIVSIFIVVAAIALHLVLGAAQWLVS